LSNGEARDLVNLRQNSQTGTGRDIEMGIVVDNSGLVPASSTRGEAFANRGPVKFAKVNEAGKSLELMRKTSHERIEG
jgi:hypothetical protein